MQKKLNIQLLGDFALEYDGKRIQLGNSYKTKVFQLLQVLLYHGAEGITTSVLIDQLYGHDAEEIEHTAFGRLCTGI